jgi:predicted transcriptional regulator
MEYNTVARRPAGRPSKSGRGMKLSEIIRVIDGQVLTQGVNLNRDVEGVCAADLMSDVLTYRVSNAILLTGLCNPQVVRTAEMADVAAIVIVRGKHPPRETIDLANAEKIPLISSPYGMFEMSGLLFRAGLSSCEAGLS